MLSCLEIPVICLGLGWEPVSWSLYLPCLNCSCLSQRSQLTGFFSLWENPPWKDPRECLGCCDGQAQPLGPAHGKGSGTPHDLYC